jgi:hypothetical protein
LHTTDCALHAAQCTPHRICANQLTCPRTLDSDLLKFAQVLDIYSPEVDSPNGQLTNSAFIFEIEGEKTLSLLVKIFRLANFVHFLLQLLLNLVKDSLLSAGGKKNASGELSFPLHNRNIDCNSDSSEHFWLPVQDSLVDHSSLECAGQSFDAATFFRFLDTELLGKSILFAERIPSTINILDRSDNSTSRYPSTKPSVD